MNKLFPKSQSGNEFFKMILLAFFLVSSLGHTQTFNESKLDSVFDVLEAHDKFMGSIAISKNGNSIYSRTLGYAVVENRKRPDSTTKYRIGSISKTFTATLILMAFEEGKIGLDDTLSKFFPEIENAEDITITNLLQHQSGIFNFTNAPDYLTWNTQAKTRENMLEIIKKHANVFKPGSQTAYSNSNYVLLAFILEDIFKKPYSQIIAEKIAIPLKLQNTYVGGPIAVTNNESYSYRFSGKWMKQNETDMSIPIGAGSIVSTPSDLNTFIIALFNKKLISAENLEKMTTTKNGMGLGLIQFPFRNQMGYGHNGGIDGFSSFLGYLENSKIAIALTSNGTVYNNNDILIHALSAVEGYTFDIPDFTEKEVNLKVLNTYIGIYSSEQFPLKITVSVNNGTLTAQATGQSSFPLTATSDTVFRFDGAGIVMEFVPDTNKMILKQGGAVFNYVKE
ncbi:serine hydrolase domain-containing protein [Flagellimonas sp.]|uniref:serine hydrolase domain-containing protein n=1 Tax=Flagellimonas sp. TaxID=2058762 RepID=UPI003B5291B6